MLRLWHKDLLGVLPRQQLLGQWRECCSIALNIVAKNTPNHILVNKIMDYPLEEFAVYWLDVRNEMLRRGYTVHDLPLITFCREKGLSVDNIVNDYVLNNNQFGIYKDWHNDRYFKQCISNLEEKYDCGGITKEEWRLIQAEVTRRKHR